MRKRGVVFTFSTSCPAFTSIAYGKANLNMKFITKQADLDSKRNALECGGHLASLLDALTPRADIATQLADDRGLVASDQAGNLVSFNLAVVFVGHGQLRLAGQEALNAKHSQPPSPQLIKVALRA